MNLERVDVTKFERVEYGAQHAFRKAICQSTAMMVWDVLLCHGDRPEKERMADALLIVTNAKESLAALRGIE